MSDGRTPVLVLTGFLGSGKTTILNHWLGLSELSDAAVIVNEFGEIGIDHSLISSSNDNTIELSTGCLCCVVRGDMVETLRELHERRLRGEIRPFTSVIVETTGLADPAPVVQMLMTLPVVRQFRLSRVVTTVDAVHGIATLARYREAVRQVAVADDVIITKEDLLQENDGSLEARLRRLNPGANIHRSRPGQIPAPADLSDGNIYDPSIKPAEVAGWLKAEAFADDGSPDCSEHAHAHDDHHHDVALHDASIRTFSIEVATPLAWEEVALWLDALIVAHGEQLLRMKGIAWIKDREKPIVLQAVQQLFHPPAELPQWPPGPRLSRFVFIAHDLSAEYVREVLETIRSRGQRRAASPSPAHQSSI